MIREAIERDKDKQPVDDMSYATSSSSSSSSLSDTSSSSPDEEEDNSTEVGVVEAPSVNIGEQRQTPEADADRGKETGKPEKPDAPADTGEAAATSKDDVPMGNADDVGAAEEESVPAEDQNFDEFSEISDNSDLFHVEAVQAEEPRTDEDADLRLCEEIMVHLREHPLMPVDGRDTMKTESFTDTHSGVRLPLCHCSFKGCDWSYDVAPKEHWEQEFRLFLHLRRKHRTAEMASLPEHAWALINDEEESSADKTLEDEEESRVRRTISNMDALAYYMRACQMREQERIPILGPSLDRRQLNQMVRLLNSETVTGLTCFSCATVNTYVQSWCSMYHGESGTCRVSRSDIQYRQVRYSLWAWLGRDASAFNANFSLALFKSRYATDDQEGGNWAGTRGEVLGGLSEILMFFGYAPCETENNSFLKRNTQN